MSDTNHNTPLRLGVNIDHVATIRQARGTRYPSPLAAAFVAQSAGADGITVHLREDRRHIQERDVEELRQAIGIPLNLELSLADEIVAIAERVQPHFCCLVPERRQELTTEGGLDVAAAKDAVAAVVERMHAVGTRVSLFVEADEQQVEAAVAVGADAIEIHTGRYANLDDPADLAAEVGRYARTAASAAAAGLNVHAGHGLSYANVGPIARIPEIEELNIGHSLIADALLMGMPAAVARMKAQLMQMRAQPIARSATD